MTEDFRILVDLGGDVEKKYGEFLDQTYSLAAIDGELAESFVSKFKDVLRFLIENPIEESGSKPSKKKADPWNSYQEFYQNLEEVSKEDGSEGGKVLLENAAEWFEYLDKEFGSGFPNDENYFAKWRCLTTKIGEVQDGGARSAVARATIDTLKSLKEKESEPNDWYKFYFEFGYAVEKIEEIGRFNTAAARAFAENLPEIVKYPGVLKDYNPVTDRRKLDKWDFIDEGDYSPLTYDVSSRFGGLDLLVTRLMILGMDGKLEKAVKDLNENPGGAIDKYFRFVKLKQN